MPIPSWAGPTGWDWWHEHWNDWDAPAHWLVHRLSKNIRGNSSIWWAQGYPGKIQKCRVFWLWDTVHSWAPMRPIYTNNNWGWRRGCWNGVNISTQYHKPRSPAISTEQRLSIYGEEERTYLMPICNLRKWDNGEKDASVELKKEP